MGPVRSVSHSRRAIPGLALAVVTACCGAVALALLPLPHTGEGPKDVSYADVADHPDRSWCGQAAVPVWLPYLFLAGQVLGLVFTSDVTGAVAALPSAAAGVLIPWYAWHTTEPQPLTGEATPA